MSAQIPVRRIPCGEGHILEFIVTDQFTIHYIVLADRDPTSTDTSYITIASDDCHRGGEVDEESGELIESSLEPIDVFCKRAHEEAKEFAIEEIVAFREQKEVADTLRKILPPAYDR